jgi:ribonuclease HII
MPAPQSRVNKVFQPPPAAPISKMARLKQLVCSDAHERRLRRQGYRRIAGVDEVGRGALFGPVVAAAVVLPEQTRRLARMGLRDSKQLTCELREELDVEIRGVALAVGVAEVDAATIDAVNIYQASRLAMLRAVEAMEACSPGLEQALDHLLIDAMKIDHPCAQTKLIYGDSLSLSIAAASVVAKVYRDALMRRLDAEYPQYGLAAHKGYGTPQHKRALLEHGPCVLHRRSFAPVAAVLGGQPLTLEALLEGMDEEFALDDVILETVD